MIAWVLAAVISTSLCHAGDSDAAAAFRAHAMDLRYRIHKSAGGAPLSDSMKALDQAIETQTEQGEHNAFQRALIDAKNKVQRQDAAKTSRLKSSLHLDQLDADLAAKDPNHSLRGRSPVPVLDGREPGPGMAGAGGSEAGLSNGKGAVSAPSPARKKTSLDGSKVKKEIDFGEGAPKDVDSGLSGTVGPDGIYTPKAK